MKWRSYPAFVDGQGVDSQRVQEGRSAESLIKAAALDEKLAFHYILKK